MLGYKIKLQRILCRALMQALRQRGISNGSRCGQLNGRQGSGTAYSMAILPALVILHCVYLTKHIASYANNDAPKRGMLAYRGQCSQCQNRNATNVPQELGIFQHNLVHSVLYCARRSAPTHCNLTVEFIVMMDPVNFTGGLGHC